MMKIKKETLQKIINECVAAKISELSESTDARMYLAEHSLLSEGFNWDNMKYLHGRGKLHGKWHIIMTAYLEAGEDPDRAMAMLTAAVATMQASKERDKAAQTLAANKPEDAEMASVEDLTDFSKLV